MKQLKVGMIGAGFMAKAHSLAYATMPMFFWPAPGIPVRHKIADLTAESAKEAAARLGFAHSTGNWKDLVDDPEIDVIDIVTPNDSHAEIAIAAAKAGKHIFCEKPISRTLDEAKAMRDAVKAAKVRNMLAFNYRRTPAVQLAKKYIAEGALGKLHTFRGTYLQDWSASPDSPLSWRFQKKVCGSGALGDIGTHVVDIARFLIGDFTEVAARLKTYIPERPVQTGAIDNLGTVKGGNNAPKAAVDVDDEAEFAIRFANGAAGSIEATRNAWGRNNFITFEINGETGSLYFNYERRDELQVCFASDPGDRRGFRTIYTGPAHPYGEGLWPIPALGIGYSETKIVECYDFFKSIAEGRDPEPNFEDGYQIERICDAVVKSNAAGGNWTKIA
jgi:predicted dehydrogenase